MSKQTNNDPADRADRLFDLNGFQTGLPMDKKRTLSVVLAAAVFLICSFSGPALGLDVPRAGTALGLVLAGVVLWVTNQFDLVVGSLLIGKE